MFALEQIENNVLKMSVQYRKSPTFVLTLWPELKQVPMLAVLVNNLYSLH
jgi:hypothetical protein